EYARSGGGSFTLVTLDGEVIRPDGSATGGALEGAAVGALQKKREISELTDEVRRVEERYNEILTRHYQLQKQMGHTEGVLKGLAKNQHAEELNLAAQEKDLHKAGADLARLRDRLSVLDGEDEQFAQSLGTVQVEEENSRGEVAHGQTDREGREEKVRQLTSELESLRNKSDQLSADFTTLRVKVAANSERDAAARKELEQIGATRRELEDRLLKLLATVTEGGERIEELERRIETATAAKLGSAQRLVALSADLETRRKAHVDQTAQVKDEDTQLRELRTRVDQLTQGLSQASLRERELALELSHLVEQIRERHALDLEGELHRYHLLALPPDAESRLKDLRGQLERMGEINLTAIEEHAELNKRYEFLAGQKKDLEDSLAQLHDAISKIDKTSAERFQQTFEVVNEKFQQIFPRLFGGGRAGLVLTNEGPGAEPGVEIVSQPPGKKLQSVNLLSGGEKALTAVSLIFAIFLIKPTPFCLLDEVDAPLDEGNVGRYNEMVKEMSKQSQFILITHNKRTMEIADTLYGVTMEEPGISKLVSVNMKSAGEAHNDDKQAGGTEVA
ncbi:MAG TPA: chromosome segregation protein SMC, partial [Myxococcaceae bacterium]|nr:chromosome segregation protein SMC [Myxococcaceae bacterium]